jgi:CRP-like cAMP-binding protein
MSLIRHARRAAGCSVRSSTANDLDKVLAWLNVERSHDDPINSAIEHLFDHPLFDGVPAAVVEAMLWQFRPVEVASGRWLKPPSTGNRCVYLVFRGQIGVYLPVPRDRPMLLEMVGAGGIEGLLSASGHRGHASRAEEPSLVASVPWAVLRRTALMEPRLMGNLLDASLTLLARRESRLEALAQKAPTQRLARQLLNICDAAEASAGNWVEVTFSHQMLADMLAIRRETVTLHLHRLVGLGAVASSGRRYRLNRTVLERVSRSAGTRPQTST